MADRDVDELESELSKKQRLINAWIAVGPEGKTTDVSDLTDSSRGYASDLRRGLEGEAEEDVEHDEIQEAYHPELVEKYRSELGEEAIDGQWEFMDRLQRRPTGDREPSTPSPSDQPTAEPTRTQPQRESQAGRQPPAGRGGTGRQPGGAQGPPGQPSPGAGQPSRPPTGPPQGRPTPGPQTGQQTGGAAMGAAPQTGQQQAPGSQSGGAQQRMQVIQQVANQLRELDNSLTYQQQQAQAEINAAPPQSVTQSMAISKYNLIVEIRQSLQELRNSLTAGP